MTICDLLFGLYVYGGVDQQERLLFPPPQALIFLQFKYWFISLAIHYSIKKILGISTHIQEQRAVCLKEETY